jgi:hypothetical protein
VLEEQFPFQEAYLAVKRQEQERTRALLALGEEASRQGYGALAILVAAFVNEDQNTDRALEISGPQGLHELREFLVLLPSLYMLRSQEEYVLGYQPALGLVSEQEEQELREWNAFSYRAITLEGRMGKWITEGGIGEEELSKKVRGLIAGVALFAAEHHQLALLTLGAKTIERSEIRLPFGEIEEEVTPPSV